jgi:hypothetical protein
MRRRWHDPGMGQVIAFPKRRPARRSAAVDALWAIAYVVGFFIAGPMLAVFALAFALTLQLFAALVCAASLAIVVQLTRAAYARL